MFNLFSKDILQYGVSTPNVYKNFKQYSIANYNILYDFYMATEYKLNNSHKLVKLLDMFGKTDVSDIFDLNIYISSVIEEIYRHFRIASSTNVGDNALVAIETREEYTNINKLRRSFDYISILYGTERDSYLSMTHDPTKFDMDKEIIGIDVRLLLIGYYYWANERKENGRGIDPAIFISQHVLLNYVRNKFEYGLFLYLVTNEVIPSVEFTFTRSNKVKNVLYTTYLKDYKEQLYRVIKGKLRMVEFMNYIKLPFSGDLHKYLLNRYLYINRNNGGYAITILAINYFRLYFSFAEIKDNGLFRTTVMFSIYQRLNTYKNSTSHPLITSLYAEVYINTKLYMKKKKLKLLKSIVYA